MDGNYSAVRDIVWDKADTVVWFDLPYAIGDGPHHPAHRAAGGHPPGAVEREQGAVPNLYSFNPEKSIIAWAATRHGVYRRRYAEAEHDPRWAGLRFVRLRSQGEADAFLADVTSHATKEE